MTRRLLLLLIAVLAGPLAAHADTFSTYYLQADFLNNATLEGDLTYDNTANEFTAADLTPSNLGYVGNLTEISATSTGELLVCQDAHSGPCYGAHVLIFFDVEPTGPAIRYLEFNGHPPPTSSSLTLEAPNAVTPEPSSFALLGSGVLGFAGLVRKRLA